MTHSDFDSVLDECLARMAEGESVDACLRKYPQHASALRPLLGVAVRLQALPNPQPGADAVRVGQQRMLAALREQKHAQAASVSPLSRFTGRIREFFVPSEGMQIRHVLRFVVAMLLVTLVVTNVAVVSSAGSIPGDPLYGVKRSWEEARLTLTFRERDREQLLEQLDERRQDEVREMVRQGRQGTLDLEGVLQAVENGRWSVDGLTLVFSEQTFIEGEPEPGARVWVRAQVRNDGTLVALRVRIRTRLLPGTTTAPGETPDDMPNGRHSPTMTPMPRRTPEPIQPPQVTRTAEPTGTPRPSETPEPAETSETDPASGPAETQEPEETSGPTRTHESDHTPEPAETRESDHTPEPAETQEPEETSRPTRTSEPEHTSEPSRTHEPDHTPEATDAPEHTPAPTVAPQHTPEPPGGTGEPQHTLEPGGTPGATPHRD